MGEGGSPRSGETGEGYLSSRTMLRVERTPHPALRATFSRMGRRKKPYFAFLAFAFFALAAFFDGFSSFAFSTFTATGVLAAIRIDRA